MKPRSFMAETRDTERIFLRKPLGRVRLGLKKWEYRLRCDAKELIPEDLKEFSFLSIVTNRKYYCYAS